MAINYTENYGLCQWEATDQVLREEFNEGNRKVDEALKELDDQVKTKAEQEALSEETAARTAADEALEQKAGMKLINRVTLDTSVRWPTLDLSGIDWNQWATVRILIKPVIDPADTYQVLLNADNSTCVAHTLSRRFQMILFPSFDENTIISGLRWPGIYDQYTFVMDASLQALTNVQIGTTNNPFYPGTVMEVWGQK